MYAPRICSLDVHYTWTAINKFDKAFRRSMQSKAAGTITSWRTFPTELFNDCFVLDPAARKRSSSTNRNGGAGKGAGNRKGKGSQRGNDGRSGSGMSTTDWADKNLKHKSVAGAQLCFNFARHKSCNYGKTCKHRHDACGMCGKEDHSTQDCPTGAPAP